ncbi:MAG TPA: YhcH/YjgK/YiaL family protein [Nitrospirota bacterium]
MIVADLDQLEHQALMTPELRAALSFLREPASLELPDGTEEIEGSRVFAIVQRYDTVTPDAPKFEFHRSYVDVQFIASGEEIIGWAPVERMNITEPYDADRDICFGAVPAGAWAPVLLRSGQAAILYPEDAHAPRLAVGSPSPVMKIVVKVAVQE